MQQYAKEAAAAAQQGQWPQRESAGLQVAPPRATPIAEAINECDAAIAGLHNALNVAEQRLAGVLLAEPRTETGKDGGPPVPARCEVHGRIDMLTAAVRAAVWRVQSIVERAQV